MDGHWTPVYYMLRYMDQPKSTLVIGHLGKLHLCRFAAQSPWLLRKRFSTQHVQWWMTKPGCRIEGSVEHDWLTTVADSQELDHTLFI